ncbi:hypothetical protein LY56_01315 [Roseinatronobacter thiooxidans]|uniref:Sulfotransferase family protein n=2 Tax=Roseinatronobacter thiooxidans TaxID=121821 RepID=A0A2W7R529_9RHOB|nr:hypothetical protein LY56_01315 [Roseinatronobacter thiooxidans]
MNVLHVGMGKTGTTSLQLYVFPSLILKGVIKAYNPPPLHILLDNAVNGLVQESELAPLAFAQERMLISNETLLEWDPALWEASADRLLRVFGRDAIILITLRAPRPYLRSLYQQMLHHGKIRPPEDFFLPSQTYRAVRRFLRPGELDAIDVDDFDMVHMVSLFTARFSRVVLVPIETIGELRFLSAIWGISDDVRAQLATDFSSAPRANTSYSRLAVRLTLGRERLLSAFGVQSASSSNMQMHKALAHARGEVMPVRSRILVSWHKLMVLLSRYGPRTGYQLPENLYLGRHMARNEAFYRSVREASDGYLSFLDGEANGCTPSALTASEVDSASCS